MEKLQEESNKIQKWKTEMDMEMQKMEREEGQVDDELARVKKALKEVTERKKHLRTELQTKEDEKLVLESKARRTRNRKMMLLAAAKEHMEMVRALWRRLHSVQEERKEIASGDAHLRDLLIQLEEKISEESAMKDQVARLENEIKETEAAHRTMLSDWDKLKKEAADKAAEEDRLDKAIMDMDEKIQHYQCRTQETEEKIAAKERALNEIKIRWACESEQLDQQIQTLQKTIPDIYRSIQSCENIEENLKDEVKCSKDGLERERANLKEQETQLKAIQDDQTASETRLFKLKEQKELNSNALAKLQEDHQNEKDTAKKSKQILKETLGKEEEALVGLNKKLEEAKETKQLLDERIEKLTKRQEEYEALEDVFKNKQVEVDRLEDEVTKGFQTHMSYIEISHGNEILSNQLKYLNNEFDEYKKKLEAKNEEKKALEATSMEIQQDKVHSNLEEAENKEASLNEKKLELCRQAGELEKKIIEKKEKSEQTRKESIVKAGEMEQSYNRRISELQAKMEKLLKEVKKKPPLVQKKKRKSPFLFDDFAPALGPSSSDEDLTI